MNFLELIFTVCAIGNADICQDRHIAVEQEVTLTRCVMQAQPTLARWAADNPDWRIVGWHCDYSQSRKEKA